jgi:uncharacterized protein YgbK (DUF1537 family)
MTIDASHPSLSLTDLAGRLPAPYPDAGLGEATRRRILAGGCKLIAIDDDPTGCQTVHDVPLLLEWSVEALQAGLRDPAPLLFVLANTRAQDAATAMAINREIAANLRAAAASLGKLPFAVLSRSDSTLRGHFPAETDALSTTLGPYDGVILAPCFFESGRHTLSGVHYVRQGDQLTPAAQTESARDPTFGFAHSYLPDWVEEKSAGRVRAADVLVVSIEDIRRGGPARVSDLLRGVCGGRPIVADAFEYADLDVFVAGLLDAEAAGQRFLYRSAAGFLRVRAGIAERPLLSRRELLGDGPARGLVVVGSFVPRSTAQLQHLLQSDPAAGVELDVATLLSAADPAAFIAGLLERLDAVYDAGRTPALHTSRSVVVGDGALDSLRIMGRVSDALTRTVAAAVRRRPYDFVIGKGGITSHQVAQVALGARQTRVLGQIAAGVPVWRLGPESALPDRPYVVFPGNVGGPETLTEVVKKLSK